MDADLTCPTCDGMKRLPARAREGLTFACHDCHATGRRPPTLSEWDTLRAERDRLQAQARADCEAYVTSLAEVETERDRYRAIVRDLAACAPPVDFTWGVCHHCGIDEHREPDHTDNCPYARARAEFTTEARP